MFINGQWVNGNASFAVTNPATGEEIGRVADAQRDDIDAAITSAADAFRSWSKSTAYQRSACLQQAHRLMLEQKAALAKLMSEEQGKPYKAALAEVQYGADFLLWFAEEAKRLYGETIPSARADQRFLVQHQPVGVVAAITPWNYPISMITRKIAPAVAAGCTIVLKPAEATPLCAVAMFRIFEQAGFPPGVVNLITAADPKPIGEQFCSDPRIAKLSFTGSTAVGQHLATLAAPHVKRVSMELGGHAPAIVFKDADPIHAAKGLAMLKFLNAGQACISPNRIFIHQDILGPFLEEFSHRVSRLKVGNGLEEGVAIGPLVNPAALTKVATQVEDALAKGALLLQGGKVLTQDGLDQGCFYAPTLLTGVTPEMKIYREETFGPVAPVIAFSDEAEVLEMANDTHYGLAAYLYTESLSRALRVSEALNFGIIGINDINPTAAAAPFGGMKQSGIGREGARQGLLEYVETKLIGLSINDG